MCKPERRQLPVLGSGLEGAVLAASALCMVLGASIYLGWRPKSILAFAWLSQLGLTSSLTGFRTYASQTSFRASPWIVQSLPQGLWVLSGLLALRAVWRSFGWQYWMWCGIVVAFAVGLEGGQKLGLVPGVFDIEDLQLILIAFFIAQTAALLSHRLEQERNP